MRLLDTTSLRLKTFAGPPARYAILSHTWGSDEVLFEDIEARNNTAWRQKAGGPKLLSSARVARENGFDLIWIDNCCIDKSSSAELSESINSMFQWYAQATVCIAFLSDLGGRQQLPDCRWFTRGFTLQELVAPKEVRFYNCDWLYVGSRSERATEISLATGINEEALQESVAGRVGRWSVYERMRWASSRETSKEEDLAYCLLGLFDVNMALVYGEGLRKAFRRLQEEILAQSNDQSIIFHQGPHALAQGPRDFCADLNIVRRPEVNLARLDAGKTVGLERYQVRSALLTQDKVNLVKSGLNVNGTVCEVNAGREAFVILDLEVNAPGMLGLRPALRLVRSRHEWTRALEARCLVLPGGGNGFVANIDEDYNRHGVQFDLPNVLARTSRPQDLSGAEQRDITISDYKHQDALLPPPSPMPRSPRLLLKDVHCTDYSLRLGYDYGPNNPPWSLWNSILDLEGEPLGQLTLQLPCSRRDGDAEDDLRVCSIANFVWLMQKLSINGATHNRFHCLLVFVSLPDTTPDGYGTMASVIVPLKVLYPELTDPYVQTYPGEASPYLLRPTVLQALQDLANDDGERGRAFRTSANKPVLSRHYRGEATIFMVRGSLSMTEFADEVLWQFDPEVTISPHLDAVDVHRDAVVYGGAAGAAPEYVSAARESTGNYSSSGVPGDQGEEEQEEGKGTSSRQRTVVEAVGKRSTSVTGLRRKQSFFLAIIEPFKCAARVPDRELD